MKKYKIALLVVILLSLTGCSFEYNIKINTNTITEKNIVYMSNASKDNIKQEVENLVSSYTGPTNSLGMYSQSITEKNNTFGMSYKKTYDTLNDYNNSLSFSTCYDNYKLLKEKEKIVLSTSKEFNCFSKYKELDSVTININSELEVISSNADEVNNNVYTFFKNKIATFIFVNCYKSSYLLVTFFCIFGAFGPLFHLHFSQVCQFFVC